MGFFLVGLGSSLFHVDFVVHVMEMVTFFFGVGMYLSSSC